MGITKLADLIRSEAPSAISYKKINDYSGKIVALDVSIVLNQFRTAVPNFHMSALTGLFFRTLHFLEHDIKPVFVFDGFPPEQKKTELQKRAKAAGRSSFYISGKDSPRIQDCKRILELLGVPYIQAPGDGEAFCAQLVKQGKVDAVASEDMDTMPFGSELLIRQFDAKKDSDVVEYCLSKLLDVLQLTHKEFVDLCILLGCDYCEKIQGLGPKRALKLIQQHKTIEEVVLHINRQTHPVPVRWTYKEARRLFLETPGCNPPDLIWTEPNEDELVQFLCHEKHIKETRVRGRMEKFHQMLQERRKAREEERKTGQTHMEDFFRVTRKRQAAEVLRSPRSKKARPQ
ncbi:probable flap endonuclease 1 homolog isoform X1 [Brienomyrus brachyistius]|uniref:probable flap endonuclease 1 homolog isoform X1 n=2 Tax=Brienomyrus brachyistius TaxID=42636 RepID=UPI0020B1FA0F|nr:probable flap endonuclease 1 homolog isoform X1 [Brienomyrus brachyistius]